MKKIIFTGALLIGFASVAQAQTSKTTTSQTTQFTAEEQQKLNFISKHQEMAANFYRKKVAESKVLFQDVVTMMKTYIEQTDKSNPKRSEMESLLQQAETNSANFEANFDAIYNSTKKFISYI